MIGHQRHPFPKDVWPHVQITGFLKDVTDGLRICRPQAILLHARTNGLSREFECRTPSLFCDSVAYPKRTVPVNYVPEILEEPLLRSSSVFAPDIPLMSLKISTLSAIDLQDKVEGVRLTLRGHTENPRWVHRPRYIPDHRKPPAPSKKDVNEKCRTSHECSELVLHELFTI